MDVLAPVDWLTVFAWAFGVAGILWLAWPVWRQVRNRPAIVLRGRGAPPRMVSPFFIFMPAAFSLFPPAVWLTGFFRSGHLQLDRGFAGFWFVWLGWLVVMQLAGNRQILASIEREKTERAKGWLSRDDGI